MLWLNDTIEKIQKEKKPPFLVSDYKTPSGKIHVGALRGVIIHDIVYKALKNSKAIAEFNYGFDDMDPMDSFPIYLAEDFKKYMGIPLFKIPSPKKGFKSFAEFYAKDFEDLFENLGVNPKILWTSKLYQEGKLNKAIEIALDNAEEIRKIYLEISGTKREKDWFPFQVICPNCGKIGTTRVFDWDKKEVEFECQENLVVWAKGCGYKGKISPFDGNGKLPWKIEWAAKWFLFGTDFEAAGKDHYTKGGSRDIAEAVARRVFKIEPPVGSGYEFFLISGKKMASSKGLGISAREVSKILPPEILRFLMVKTPIKRPIEFNPEGETIPRLFDAYDEQALEQSEVFKYSQISEPKKIFRMRFSKIAYLIQMPNVDLKQKVEEEKGEKLSKDELENLEIRKHFAEIWLKNYAPEYYKFEVKNEMPKEASDLNEKQKQFLTEILKLLELKTWQGDKLHEQIHELKNNMNLDAREAFSAIYLVFIGKDSGPQAGWFLTSLDKNFVINRLKEVL